MHHRLVHYSLLIVLLTAPYWPIYSASSTLKYICKNPNFMYSRLFVCLLTAVVLRCPEGGRTRNTFIPAGLRLVHINAHPSRPSPPCYHWLKDGPLKRHYCRPCLFVCYLVMVLPPPERGDISSGPRGNHPWKAFEIIVSSYIPSFHQCTRILILTNK